MSDFGTIHEMVTCPYNPAHQVGASKFASHLLKCRKQNAAGGMVICEYNQLHHVNMNAMDEHLKSCQEYLNHQLHLLTQNQNQDGNPNSNNAAHTHQQAQEKEQQSYPYVQDDDW